jgi:uncharacterized protein YukE
MKATGWEAHPPAKPVRARDGSIAAFRCSAFLDRLAGLAQNEGVRESLRFWSSQMSQAIVDPAELRRFAQALKVFNGDLENRMQVLHGQLGNLSQTWRDQENLKFVAEFDQTMVAIRRFVEASNEHIPFLLRKAERVEEYLTQR